jgi:hypothetical protein
VRKPRLIWGIEMFFSGLNVSFIGLLLFLFAWFFQYVKAHPKETRQFLGFNPYLQKKQIAEKYQGRVAKTAVILAIVFSICGFVLMYSKPKLNVFSLPFVLTATSILLPCMLLTKFVLRKIIKKEQIRIVVAGHREMFNSVKEILQNDGWRNDQLNVKDSLADPERCLKANWETADERLGQIEELLEVNPKVKDRRTRVKALEVYFS